MSECTTIEDAMSIDSFAPYAESEDMTNASKVWQMSHPNNLSTSTVGILSVKSPVGCDSHIAALQWGRGSPFWPLLDSYLSLNIL